MKRNKQSKGITLVALVVTIVVLLILAGITIVYVFGDNGIFQKAQEAKNKTDDAIRQEQEGFDKLMNTLKNEYGGGNENGNGDEGGSTTNPPTQPDNPKPPTKEPTIVGVVDKIQENNITVEDANGNPIVVPGGFKVVPNSPEETDESKKVDYTYNGDGTPAVQDGIVIEDEEGNQFVWIPVGEIKNKDNTTTTITLGRYTFDTTNGTPTLVQDAKNYQQTPTLLETCRELSSGSGNTPARNLGDFITKTKTNNGYYLGRYEASKGTDNKAKSQANKIAWGSVIQAGAATQARNMYSSDYVESDLVNSYSWDTAIVFIQRYSENSNYANQKPVNSSKLNTGMSGDKVCNIYDMASNCWEWSTENYKRKEGSSISESNTCVARAGGYNLSNGATADRIPRTPDQNGTYLSFRPICYVK